MVQFSAQRHHPRAIATLHRFPLALSFGGRAHTYTKAHPLRSDNGGLIHMITPVHSHRPHDIRTPRWRIETDIDIFLFVKNRG